MATEGSSASSSSADTSEKVEVTKKAADLLAQGKRNMVCGEVPKAVSLYEEAVQMLVKECGELSRDCADAYFMCGSALLELGRMETNVLGAALEGVDVEEEKDEEASEQFEKPPAEDDEERQKLREEVYEAMAEGEREEELKSIKNKSNQACSELVTIGVLGDKTECATEVTEMETDSNCEQKDDGVREKNGEKLVNGVSDDIKEEDLKNPGENEQSSEHKILNGESETKEKNGDLHVEKDTAKSKCEDNASGKCEKDDEVKITSEKEDSLKSEKILVESKENQLELEPSEGKDENISKPKACPEKNEVKEGSNKTESPKKSNDSSNKENEGVVTNGKEKEDKDKTEENKEKGEKAKTNGDQREKEEKAKTDGDQREKEAEAKTVGDLKEGEAKTDGDKKEGKAKTDGDKKEGKAKIVDDQNEKEGKSKSDGDQEKEEKEKTDGDQKEKEENAKTDEDQKEEDEKAEINKEKEEKAENDGDQEDNTGDVEMTENGAAGEGEDVEEDDGEETAEGEESQEGDENEGEEKEEDVPNFQLAWEYLDLAKVIYLKCESKEDQLKAAECHIKLGELSMETEQHDTAAEDLQSALKIQQKFLPADDRLIAETHYQLGLAYGLGKEFELSIQHYQQAISVIESKIASLNRLVEENEVDAENKENRETDDLKKYKDEIKELQELIPEMRNKIEDTRVEAKDMDQMKQMAKEILGLSGTTKGFGSPTKKVESSAASGSGDVDENGEKKATDIAHLVRKKRKPEDDTVAPTAQEIKKLRQDENSAGDAPKDDSEVKVNGGAEVAVNGVAKNCDEQNKTDSSGAEPMAT